MVEPAKKNIMPITILIGIVLISLGAIVFVRRSGPKTPAIEYSDPVSQMLENIRVKHNFPALAAAVVVDGNIVVTNAVGFRKNDGTGKVTVDDKFHLGSVTKSMTATVAAMLVEQEKISWTTTIGEAFPELKSEIHPDYLGVTLEQLLSHRTGAPGDAPGDLWRKAWAANGTAAEQRLAFIKGILARKPEAKPGTKHIYSNQGYTIAGVMLEKATSWKVLERPWANGRALMHNGSNTMFYIVVWMAPEKNCAVMVATNIGSDAAFDGCDEAAGKLIKQFFPK